MLGLDRATDPQVIDVALAGGYPIVTKDGDFSDLSLVRGLSPQGVWLRIGNCTTDEIEALIRAHFGAITEFEAEGTAGTLELLLH